MAQPEIVRTASSVVYENRWMTVREDRIVRRSGAPGIYGVVEKRDFAVIAAIDGDRIYLVEQFRYPVAGRYWELPQGSSHAGDDALASASAELREETGLVAGSMIHAGHLFVAYGYSTQGYNVYVARNLRQLEAQLEAEEEDLIAQPFSLSAVEQMIADGVIKDATTVAALGLLRLKQLL